MAKIKHFLGWLLHPIMWRTSYAYKIRRGWGISSVRNEKELKAVVEFCREQLRETEYMTLNPDRKRIYEMTVLLYEQNQSDDREVYTKLHKFEPIKADMYNDVEVFIDDYVGWYWS